VRQDSIQEFRAHLADLHKMKGYTSDEKGKYTICILAKLTCICALQTLKSF